MAEYICPHCKKPIYDDDALLCLYCGESLQRGGSGFLGNIKYANHKVIWFFITFLVLISFVFLMLR